MATVINFAGWVDDDRLVDKPVFRIEIECESDADIPEFPISWVGKPVKVQISLPLDLERR